MPTPRRKRNPSENHRKYDMTPISVAALWPEVYSDSLVAKTIQQYDARVAIVARKESEAGEVERAFRHAGRFTRNIKSFTTETFTGAQGTQSYDVVFLLDPLPRAARAAEIKLLAAAVARRMSTRGGETVLFLNKKVKYKEQLQTALEAVGLTCAGRTSHNMSVIRIHHKP